MICIPPPSHSAARQQGFSLVELMISMTLGLATIAAIGYMYLGTTQTYRSQDSIARLQEGARYAFEVIGNDLRMTGATGCSHETRANVLTSSTDWYKNLFEQPLVSFEQNGVAGVTEFSDALSVLRADVSTDFVVQNHDPAAAVFTLSSPHNFSAGDFLVATDCRHVAVFRASAVGGSTVSHAAGGGNSTAELGEGGVHTYLPGARVYRLNSVTYYIDQNPAGQPSLYRLRPVGAAAVLTPEELVEGVEDLQVAFGVDTSPGADGEADFIDPDGDGDPYLRGDQVNTGAVPGATAEERWARVVSVRVSLLMRTVEDNVMPSAQTYTYNGAPIVAPDRRLRKVFTHVIKLRNR